MKYVKLFENWMEDENMESDSTLEYTPEADVNSVTPEAAKSLIIRSLNTKGATKPIMLVGAPGSGKTEVITQAADEAGVELIMIDLSTTNLEDFIGLPKLSTNEIPNVQPGESGVMSGKIEDTAPSWLPIEGSGIIILDSINQADPKVANAAIRFAQSGRLGGAQLPEGWLIVATAHGTKEEDITTSSVILDRFTVLHLGSH